MPEVTDVKLKPEVKEKWLAALRSGEYKQAREVLRGMPAEEVDRAEADPDYEFPKDASYSGYCCLGVLCDLYVKEDPDVRTQDVDWNDGMPPVDVRLWALNREVAGYYDWPVPYDVPGETKGAYEGLASLNDENKLTFPQIADLIEEHL